MDGIHNWGHGLVGQFIIEPRGSTYHDPQTGAPVDSGTIVDIHTTNTLAKGIVDGSFREAVLMHAVARLVLHPGIANIQTSWVKMGGSRACAC